MYLSELKLWNFRKYGIKGGADFDQSEPGISMRFHEGVNVIIGENDSGKTAIIDAIRYVLHTKSGEYIYVDEKDFFQPKGGKRTSRMKIECLFRGLSANDAGLFLECLSVEPNQDGTVSQILRVTLSARRLEDGHIIVKVYTGNGGEGNPLPHETRDCLSVVYLKPLRDALQDMTHGYKSRLSQILQAHSVFSEMDRDEQSGKHKLENHYSELKNQVDNYFSKEDATGSLITKTINNIIRDNFSLANNNKDAVIRLTGSELPDILRQLDLILEDNKSGLGSLNLLCIAAELLLFLEQTQGLKLTLIEELEAHIHPQLQLRLIDYFSREAKFGQFILTTHSITLGSTIPLKKLIVMKNNDAYPMDEQSTKCTEQDYNFLHRFLDATKANLFFAKGLILVEGDAENLIVPEIAKIIGRDLHRYGVSIVNVGSTAYKRYVRIFQRQDGRAFDMPISIISDLDIRAIEYYEDKKLPQVYHITEDVKKYLIEHHNDDVDWTNLPSILYLSELDKFLDDNKKGRFKGGHKDTIKEYFKSITSDITSDDIELIRFMKRESLGTQYAEDIKIYLPKCWTLEYDIARSALFKKLAYAINLAKAERDGCDMTDELKSKIKDNVESKYGDTANESTAYQIFKPLNDGSVSKAITAQYFAEALSDMDKNTFESDEYLKYIVDAINHVTSDAYGFRE